MSWNSDPIDSAVPQQRSFVRTTTVEGLSYTPSPQEKSRDAEQLLATGRRSWKTLKGKGEAVWPTQLEAALLEGLEKYNPDCARPSTSVGRFPMRNRFISDYILQTTGKRRTPKQVGSRLQQLRDTCKKEKILRLITGNVQSDDEFEKGSDSGTYERSQSETPSSQARASGTIVEVFVLLDKRPAAIPVIPLSSSSMSTTMNVYLSPSVATNQGSPQTSTSNLYLPLSGLDPVVHITSPVPLLVQTIFSVFRQDNNSLLHTENALFKCLSPPIDSSVWTYSLKLVPEFWRSLQEDPDPSRYQIQQRVISLRPNRSRSLSVDGYDNIPSSSVDSSVITYTFCYPEQSATFGNTQSPISMPDFVVQHTEPSKRDASPFKSEPNPGAECYHQFHEPLSRFSYPKSQPHEPTHQAYNLPSLAGMSLYPGPHPQSHRYHTY